MGWQPVMPSQIKVLVEPSGIGINRLSILQRRCMDVENVGIDCNVSAALLQLLIFNTILVAYSAAWNVAAWLLGGFNSWFQLQRCSCNECIYCWLRVDFVLC